MQLGTLHFLSGSFAAGKTTLAQRLAAEYHAFFCFVTDPKFKCCLSARGIGPMRVPNSIVDGSFLSTGVQVAELRAVWVRDARKERARFAVTYLDSADNRMTVFCKKCPFMDMVGVTKVDRDQPCLHLSKPRTTLLQKGYS